MECTIWVPCSMYSSLLINCFWELGADAMTEPPIHAAYLRSDFAIIFDELIMFSKRFFSLGKSVLPPANTILLSKILYSSLPQNVSIFNIRSWTPPSLDSMPHKRGLNRISGALKLKTWNFIYIFITLEWIN